MPSNAAARFIFPPAVRIASVTAPSLNFSAFIEMHR